MLNLFYNEHFYYLLCSCTNPIFGKILYLRCRPKWSHPIILQISKSAISPEQIGETVILCMLILKHKNKKVIENFLVEHGQKGMWPIWSLDSKIYSISRTNRWNWLILTCWHKFIQIKRWLNILGLSLVKNGCAQSDDRTQKLTLSEEWVDEINWFFTCSYRFTNIKSLSKNICVGIIKNWFNQSVIGL